MEKDAALVEFPRGKIGFKQPETQAATPIGWDIHKAHPITCRAVYHCSARMSSDQFSEPGNPLIRKCFSVQTKFGTSPVDGKGPTAAIFGDCLWPVAFSKLTVSTFVPATS
jgi:hypothetical protein